MPFIFNRKKLFSFRYFLLFLFSFLSIVSLTYAATTLGNHISTTGTITSQGKAYLVGGVSTPVLNATSSLIDNLSVNNLRATSTLDYWLANAPTTDNLKEGTTNLYYTNQRVANYVNNNSFLTVSTTNLIAQNALLSQATISNLNSTSSLIDDLTITNTTTANHINLPDTIATAGNKGIIYKDGVPFLYNFSYGTNAGGIAPLGHNLFLGKNAGNLTMGSTATIAGDSSYNIGIGEETLHNNTIGGGNVAIGYHVLYNNLTGNGNVGIGRNVLYNNTGGSYNMGEGNGALLSNTTGNSNTAVGSYTLYYNTTGYNNTALGGSTLFSNTIGHNNTADGAHSLQNNTTGYSNTALGFESGKYASNLLPNATSTYSLYLGADTKPLVSGDTNEIVIGANAVGAGSNSVVLGNDSITKTLLKGNVGIGTTTPAAALTVAGSSYLDGTVTTPLLYATSSLIDNLIVTNTTTANHINLPSTIATAGNKGIIYKDGIPFLYDFNYGTNANGIILDGRNLFLGKNAGNLTMGNGATYNYQSSWNTGIGYNVLYNNNLGFRNTGIGYNALGDNSAGSYNTAIGFDSLANNNGWLNTAVGSMSLFSNTVGTSNVAVGHAALYNNSSGNYNVAVGRDCSNHNTTGSWNVALGEAAFYNNTTGYNNVVVGGAALYDNTTGFANVAVGAGAGRYTSTDLANATSTHSLYLGASTKSLASGDTNEIVIGDNAVGAGSNSVVLGNDSITKTLLKGNVGIGTTTPEEALTVGGNIYASGTVTSTAMVTTNMNLTKVEFTPAPTPTSPKIGDCFMDNGAKPQVSCYDGAAWHTLW